MEIPALAAEKTAYENAYAKVRDQLLADQFELKAVLEMDRTLDALKAKVMSAVPAERDYRAQALKFVEDLKDSTRLFDAGTVDYAKDILSDTQDHDATTVAELVSFMLKYRLQFATAERSSTARELYPKLYEALRQQAKELGIKPPEVESLKPQIPEFIQTKSGLKYRVLRKGEGATPTANQTVVVHYRGWLDNGTEFDNSYKRNKPLEVQVKGVIPGWTEGLQLVSVGGKIELTIPAKLGYGERGAGDAIPPNATLNFTVELIAIK
jgi:FKBP-type peptidyl-prolyl cis-trans isomerase